MLQRGFTLIELVINVILGISGGGPSFINLQSDAVINARWYACKLRTAASNVYAKAAIAG